MSTFVQDARYALRTLARPRSRAEQQGVHAEPFERTAQKLGDSAAVGTRRRSVQAEHGALVVAIADDARPAITFAVEQAIGIRV